MKPPEDASKIYNPYAGLRNVGSGAHPAFRVSRQPEFVFQEEARSKRRAFSENIGFYTGVGYLSGAVGGGAVGLAHGISQRPEGLNLTRRLLLNRLLNSSGQTGRTVGTFFGVCLVWYACFWQPECHVPSDLTHFLTRGQPVQETLWGAWGFCSLYRSHCHGGRMTSIYRMGRHGWGL